MVRACRHLSALLFLACALFAQAPKITKVDPPNWWANYPHNPMPVARGGNRAHAQVPVRSARLKIEKSGRSAAGGCGVLYLAAPNGLKPGTAKCRGQTSTANGSFGSPFAMRPGV